MPILSMGGVRFGAADKRGTMTIATVNTSNSPYTVQSTDIVIECDVTGGPVTVVFENTPLTANMHTVKNTAGDSSINPITVSGVTSSKSIEDINSPGTFPAGKTTTIKQKGGAGTWLYDGTRWIYVY